MPPKSKKRDRKESDDEGSEIDFEGNDGGVRVCLCTHSYYL